MDNDQRFELIKILFDKLLIGLIIIIVGIIGNTWIEKYKDSLAYKRAFYDKKFEMVNKMQLSFKELTKEVFICIDCDAPEECFIKNDKKLIAAISNYAHEINAISPYITDEYAKVLERYLWLYGADFKSIKDIKTYADFFQEIESSFDKYLRAELNNASKKDCFALKDLQYTEVQKMSSTKYMLLNFSNWQQKK